MDVERMENKFWKKVVYPLLTIVLLFLGVDNFTDLELLESSTNQNMNSLPTEIIKGEFYDGVQEVVDYIDLYGELPLNYLTKEEAHDLGWLASEGNLWEVASGQSIGGDYFGNFEESLPEASGREYQEADINYQGGYRDGERLVFSNDGLCFYTEDHYESFEEIFPSGELE